MSPPDGYHEIVKFASYADDERRRPEMLELARRLSGHPEASAAFLWIYDEDKERFHLDHHEPMEPGHQLSRMWLAGPPASAREVARFASLAYPEKVLYWLSRGLPRREGHYFHVRPRGAPGFLAVHTAGPIPDDNLDQLRALADVMASRITRHRDRRRIEMSESISRLVVEKPDRSRSPRKPNDWFQVAASVARKATLAEFVVVFRQGPDLSYRAAILDPPDAPGAAMRLASSPLIGDAFEDGRTYRALDPSDPDQLSRLFLRPPHDTPPLDHEKGRGAGAGLHSWMAAPVVSDGQVVAVVFAANKNPAYLPGVFSPTDESLLKHLCEVVSRGYVQTQATTAIREISDFIFKNALEWDRDEGRRLELLNTIRNFVPGVEAVGVSLRFSRSETAKDLWKLGGTRASGAMDVLDERMRSPLRPRPPAPAGWHFIDEELPSVGHGQIAVMHVALRRPELASFEREVLRFLGSDLGQAIRSERAMRKMVDDLIQVRHALRASLQGVRHIDIACQIFRRLAKHGLARAPAEDVKELGEALENTRMFASRSTFLLEEARFLLGRISAIRAEVSIVTLVREAMASLGPYAAQRGVRLALKHAPDFDDRVFVDRLLVSMAVFNLIDNAIKYSHRDNVVMTRLSPAHGAFRLDVGDVGEYIPSEFQAAIFKPFVRRPSGDPSHARPGTGLGLAVVKEVAEVHGGWAKVRSTPLDPRNPAKGAETVFSISLSRR